MTRLRDVRGELGMALHHRHRARAPAFVGDRKFRRGAEREGRDHLDRERRGVVVVDHDADVRLDLGDPLLGALEAAEHPLPVRLRLAMVVDRRADRRHVRRCHSCDDPSHVFFLCWPSTLLVRLTILDPAFAFAGPAAVAFDRAAAAQHHVGVVLLRRAGHHRREMLERMAVGRAELGGEVDVAAELQHPVVLALEDRLALIGGELRKLGRGSRLVVLERLAVLRLHQRHAEHVELIALARAVGVEHIGARDVVVVLCWFFVLRAPSAAAPPRLSLKRLIYR